MSSQADCGRPAPQPAAGTAASALDSTPLLPIRLAGVNDPFEAAWQRVIGLADATFATVRRKQFSYRAVNGGISMNTTNRVVPRGDFKKAFERMPAAGPGALQDLQGPSYVYAILMDPRVRG